MVFTFSQCASEGTLTGSPLHTLHIYNVRFFDRSRGTVCLGHEAERGLVFNVCEARFVVQFPRVFRRPDLGGADGVLLPELLFVTPGQRVTGQGRQAVIRVAG